MTVVLPEWVDQLKGVDFTAEKELLRDLEQWAVQHGWEVSDGSSLQEDLRRRTDVLLSQNEGKRYLRIAVLPKSKGGVGRIRMEAIDYDPFIHRTFDLIYQRRYRRWRVEVATVPLSNDLGNDGWDWLAKLAFSP